ncbi:MAG TPA: hypothetical protein VFT75_07780 [Nocardioidaceae bacterium]|jgi:hypothetical protein|nr:hypothetical protein [Nocardioidaceae bacterium]
MVWFLIALVAALVCGYVVRRGLRARERRRLLRAQLDGVGQLLSEDLTVLGADLGLLDREVAGVMLDDATRADLENAHASYASAQRGATRIHTTAGAGVVATALGETGYRVTCVRARMAGEEPPERRSPCFFDPRHGASSDEVMWTDPVHGTRTVPACARDAALVAEGGNPSMRVVRVGGRHPAYWEAGAPAAAYYLGWFGAPPPFLPEAQRRRWTVDPHAVELAEGEAAKYGTPTGPTGASGGLGGFAGSG